MISIFSQNTSVDNTKQELASVRQQLESYQARVNQLESLLLRNVSSDTRTISRRVRPSESTVIPLIDDDSSKDDDTDSNMIDLTNVPERSPSPVGFSTQQFSTTTSAIDILHSIIQETTSSLDLPTMKKMKVRKLDDDTEENDDYLVRPLVQNQKNFQRSFNKYGGHSIPITRRINNTSFKSKPKLTKSKSSSTKNNLKITTFFDLN
jgi:hypothetical protein